jgi:hypothetical protein
MSLRSAGCEGGEWVAQGDCSPIALPLRPSNAGTAHSADACDVQFDAEENIPFVAAVGQVPDKAGTRRKWRLARGIAFLH